MCSAPERDIDSSQMKMSRPCDAVVPDGAQGFLHVRDFSGFLAAVHMGTVLSRRDFI
jgi:hypothetical protein